MRKKLSLVFLSLAFLGTAVGCNKTGDVSSTESGTSETSKTTDGDSISTNKASSSDSSTKTSTSSTSTVPTYIPTLDEFLGHFKDYNLSIENTYYKIDYYGENAFVYKHKHSKFADLMDDAGYVRTATSGGKWTWDKDDNGAFALGFMNDTNDFYTTMADEYQNFYSALDSLSYSKESWTANAKKSGVYTVSDNDETDLLPALANLASYYAGEKHAVAGSVTSVSACDIQLTITNQFTATLSYKAIVNGVKTKYPLSIKITNAGANTATGLDEFVNDSESDLIATDFSDEAKDAMTEIMNSSLSFTSAGWTRGYQYSIGTDAYTKKQTTLTYLDLLSGDQTTTFGASLSADGWTAGTTQTSKYGYSVYSYSKVVAQETETTGAKVATIRYYYVSKDKFSSTAQANYKNGVMAFYLSYGYDAIYGLDKVNALLAKTPLKDDGTAAVPQLDLASYNLASDAIAIGDFAIDYNAQNESEDGFVAVQGFYQIVIKFEDKATSLTAMNAYVTTLKSNSFRTSGTTTLATDGSAAFTLQDRAFKNKLNFAIALTNASNSSTEDADGTVIIQFYF